MASLTWPLTLDSTAGMSMCWGAAERSVSRTAKQGQLCKPWPLTQPRSEHTEQGVVTSRSSNEGYQPRSLFSPTQSNPIQLVPLLSVWLLKQRLFWRGGLYLWGAEFEPPPYHVSDIFLQGWPQPTVRNTYYTATHIYVPKIFMNMWGLLLFSYSISFLRWKWECEEIGTHIYHQWECNGIVSLENNWAVPQNLKSRVIKWSRNSIPRYISKRNLNIHPYKLEHSQQHYS